MFEAAVMDVGKNGEVICSIIICRIKRKEYCIKRNWVSWESYTYTDTKFVVTEQSTLQVLIYYRGAIESWQIKQEGNIHWKKWLTRKVLKFQGIFHKMTISTPY